jgi:hypothetical protein
LVEFRVIGLHNVPFVSTCSLRSGCKPFNRSLVTLLLRGAHPVAKHPLLRRASRGGANKVAVRHNRRSEVITGAANVTNLAGIVTGTD